MSDELTEAEIGAAVMNYDVAGAGERRSMFVGTVAKLARLRASLSAQSAEIERLREACGAAEALHALVEALAYTLKNALPGETHEESMSVRQDRCVAIDSVKAADDLIRGVRAALADDAEARP